MRAVAQPGAHVGRERVVAERAPASPAVPLDELAAQRLAERRRRLGDLLEQEVREVAPVDVAGGDLRPSASSSAVTGQRRCRRRPSGAMPVERAGRGAVEHDDLAAAGARVRRVGRRLAVHAEVAWRSPRPRRRAREATTKASVGQADVERLAAAPQGEQQVGRARRRRWRAMATEPSKLGDRVAERLVEVGALGRAGATRASG